MTQPELASAAGIAVSALQAIEQGRSDPKLSTVLALLDALKIRGVELAPETGRVACGVVILRDTASENLGTDETNIVETGRPEANFPKANSEVVDKTLATSKSKGIGRGRPRRS